MRPASIISMIVAVLLIVAGFVTCLIAKNMAEAEGQALFAETRDYGLVNTIDLAETTISKLDIRVSDADVHIYGGSETSYIETVNFRDNYYSCNTSNRVVTFDEVADVTSMLKFWENGISFKGLRYLLSFQKEDEPVGDKVLNIYLGGENVDLKIVTLTGEKCNVYLENISYGTEYTVTLTDGTLYSTDASATTVNLGGDKVGLQMQNSTFGTCTIDCTALTMDIDKGMMPMTTIQCNTVEANITPKQTVGSLNYSVKLDSGSVTVNGNDLGTGFTQNASSNNKFTLEAVSGHVTLTDPVTDWPPTAN